MKKINYLGMVASAFIFISCNEHSGQQMAVKPMSIPVVEVVGNQFDLRAFHDTVLGSGALPLDLLEEEVKQWIAEVKG